jgi:hypothetical protein
MDTTPVSREARGDDNAHLVVDLSAVTFVDSADLYILFEALHKHDIGGGGHLAAVIDANSRRAIPDLYLVALQAAFDLHRDLAGALHFCANAGAHSRCGDPSRSGDPLKASVRASRANSSQADRVGAERDAAPLPPVRAARPRCNLHPGLAPTLTSEAAIADLNGDGGPDLTFGDGTDRTVHILLGDGTGQFHHHRELPRASRPHDLGRRL